MATRKPLGCVLFLALSMTLGPARVVVTHATVYYVATDGSDEIGDGSDSDPWATITHALESVPDGSTILVRPGTYTGRVRLRGTFAQGVTVRSEIPYQARLRNGDTVVTCFYGQGITLEGFDVAHSGQPRHRRRRSESNSRRGHPGQPASRRVFTRRRGVRVHTPVGVTRNAG
jgi:hypothetical protein